LLKESNNKLQLDLSIKIQQLSFLSIRIMKLAIIILSSILHLVVAWNGPPGCNADNCARAVTGTRLGAAHVTQAKSDCSSLLAATPTPSSLPSYAGNCPNFSAYSSACSCWGAVSHQRSLPMRRKQNSHIARADTDNSEQFSITYS
jgi:hypothetical protein